MQTRQSYAGHDMHVSNEFLYTYNDISGSGRESSSLTPGFRYLDVFGFYGNGTLKGDVSYNFNLGLKVTDDKANDVKTWSLTNLQGKLTNKVHTINLGDTFESFSQYSLSTAIKGGSYKFFDEEKDSPEITFVYGYAYPRWDNFGPLYAGLELNALERQVIGMKVKKNITQKFSMGLSYAESSDRESTRVSADEQVFKNRQYTLDAEYRPIQGLTLRTELSTSLTRETPSESADSKDYAGNAYKFEAIGEGGPSRVALEYERVSPHFLTLVGSATQDREKAKAKWRYMLTKKATMNLGFLWYRDNLHGDKENGRTDNYKPDLGLTLLQLFNRENLVLDLSYSMNRQYTYGQSAVDHIVNMNYRDRFGILDSETNLGYSIYDTRTGIRNEEEFIYNTSIGSRHTYNKLVFKPSLYLGGRTLQDELNSMTDKLYEYSIGFGFEMPESNITSNLKIGQNYLEKGGEGDSTKKTFLNFSLFYRPKFISKLNQGMLYIKAFINDFRYSTALNNFRENSITTGINIEF
jgi:hypothetical protein